MKVRVLAVLALLVILSLPVAFPVNGSRPVNASYNPGAGSKYHAPISQIELVALSHSYRSRPAFGIPKGAQFPSGGQPVPSGLTRFINDSSYMPQSETAIAVDPSNPDHVVGGFNDGRFFLCPILKAADCPSGFTKSVSGFTTSTDGGATVAKSNNLPGISVTETNLTSHANIPGFLASWGDPWVVPGLSGNFYYASLAIDPITGAEGMMVSVSNANLWNQGSSCSTQFATPDTNSCWSNRLIFGNLTFQCSALLGCGTATLDDKDAAASDLDPTSPYYGDIYVAWNHFYSNGDSSTFLARCTPSLACTMLSGGPAPVLSGTDPFADFSTPQVGTDGSVYVAWCNFGTATTFGPVDCSVRSSAPGGNLFGSLHHVMSFMGAGTDLPGDSVLQGFATEQFRAASVLTFVLDGSGKSGNLYFAVALCTSGQYFVFQNVTLPLAADNPGNCGASQVFFTRSTDHGVNWSAPTSVSGSAVIVQPALSVDSSTGNVVLAYYTTQFDPFNHRIDVVTAVSSDGGNKWNTQRLTQVSNEPDDDPSLFAYFAAFGGSFVVPQYGDYIAASASNGRILVLFTGNYVSEEGTLQSDPFLASTSETAPTLALGTNAQDAAPGDQVSFSASGLAPGSAYNLTLSWGGQTVGLANGNVGTDGTAKGSFTVPNIESQVYSVQVKDSKGARADASLGVGQVSLAGVQTELSNIESTLTSLQSSIQSSISSDFSSLNSSLARGQAQVLDSLNTLNSKVQSALNGSTSTLSVIEYLVIVLIVLTIITLVLVLVRRGGSKGSAPSPAQTSAPSS